MWVVNKKTYHRVVLSCCLFFEVLKEKGKNYSHCVHAVIQEGGAVDLEKSCDQKMKRVLKRLLGDGFRLTKHSKFKRIPLLHLLELNEAHVGCSR